MRSRAIPTELERALVEYVRAAAAALQADVLAGAEVELELGAQRGSGPGRSLFYSCRPLTERFIAERRAVLERLPEHGAAVAALDRFDGLDRYLASWAPLERGARTVDDGDEASVLRKSGARVRARTRAHHAAECLLQDVFAEQTDFDRSKIGQHSDRLAAALARLERADLASTPGTLTLVATLHGMAIASPEIKLTKGLTIVHPAELRWAPPQALAYGEDRAAPADEPDGPGHLLVALTCEAAVAAGRAILQDLLRALRLFGDGRVTFGALAWARLTGEDAWSTLAIGAGGRPEGMLVVASDQEDELRAFCNLVSRRSPSGSELAWALRRFELGCERANPYEALSDHLLALRALLEPEGPSSGQLAGRLAALCATPERRAKLTERIVKAQKLERSYIAGGAPERAASLALAREVSDHLRALLRDVICGHLSPDLPRLADELLAAPAQPPSPSERPPSPPAQPSSPSERPAGDGGQGRARETVRPPRSAEQVHGDAGQAREVVHV